MSKRERLEKRLSKLQGSLQKLGEELGTAGEKIAEQVGPGVDRAMLWTEFTHAVAPVVETAPGHTMSGTDIERVLDDPAESAAPAVEARKRRRVFIDSRGLEAWEACLRDCGRLRIERSGGRTTITRITP